LETPRCLKWKFNTTTMIAGGISKYAASNTKLEMPPAIMVVVLNFHFKQRGVSNQSRLFDLRCFTEALRRSPIDTSKILSENGHIVMDDGPFRSEYKGMGGMKSYWKIIPENDD
jgi:hypothetical protein